MKHSGAGLVGRESSLLAAHSRLQQIGSICILFLVVLSSVGASKITGDVGLDTVAPKKQNKIVTNLPAGTVGVTYSGSVSINGNGSAYQYSVSNGALPPGLTLSATTGAVIGTP